MGGEAWSPNGSWIAFHANPAGDSQIFVVTMDGATLLYYDHPGLQDLSPDLVSGRRNRSSILTTTT